MAVKTPEQRRPSEWRCQLARAVYHAMDHSWIIMVRGGNNVAQMRRTNVHAEKSNAESMVSDFDVVDVYGLVALDGSGEIFQIIAELVGIDVRYQDLGIPGLAVGRGGGVMDGKCSLGQIALEIKACSLDESLVVGIVRGRGCVATYVGPSHPLQVHIKESVRPGQQACGFRWGVLAQLDNRRHGGYEEQHSEKGRKSSAKSHFAMGKNDSRWRGSMWRSVPRCPPLHPNFQL